MASLALCYAIGSSLGVLLLVVAIQLYCLRGKNKKRIANREEPEEESNAIPSSAVNDYSDVVSWIKSSKLEPTGEQSTHTEVSSDVELGMKETVDCELIRLHNLVCPPRFLFTITEETREDLESEDARSRGRRAGKDSKASFGDIVLAIDTPRDSLSNLSFESRGSSPSPSPSPSPKLKFLTEAEEKLLRKMLVEEAEKFSAGSVQHKDARGGSFLGLLVGVHKEQSSIVNSNPVVLDNCAV